VSNIINTKNTIDSKLAQSKFKLFSQTEAITNEDFERSKIEARDQAVTSKKRRIDDDEDSDDDDDDEDLENKNEDEEDDSEDEGLDGEDESMEEDSDSQSEEDDEEASDMIEEDANDDNNSEDELFGVKWKKNMQLKASLNFEKSKKINWIKMVYGNEPAQTSAYESIQAGEMDKQTSNEEDNEFGGLFKVTRKEQQVKADNSLFVTAFQNWSLDGNNYDTIRDCFVTGKWEKEKNARDVLDGDDEVNESDFDDDYDQEGFVDLDDLAAPGAGKMASTHRRNGVNGDDTDDLADENDDDDDDDGDKKGKQLNKHERLLAKKKRQKEQFDAAFDSKELNATDGKGGETGESAFYDALKKETEEQSARNRMEFDKMDDSLRVQYEGFRPGMYIRVQIKNMPHEFVSNFNAKYLVIIGGLSVNEANIGYVQVRLKKHRWYEKVLKTNDPLIISLGWRRFQTVPLYFIQDHNMRNRSLKYTPQHMHCHASFWGPITPQNNGFLAIQTLTNDLVRKRLHISIQAFILISSIVIQSVVFVLPQPVLFSTWTSQQKSSKNLSLSAIRTRSFARLRSYK
jgi:ribosome biogenesis protein BMS1